MLRPVQNGLNLVQYQKVKTLKMVSVIIPNYNHANFLCQRINSVLNQTFQDFELILLDDCSTDNSKKLLDQYRHHPRVSQVIYNEQNSGSTFRQWKKGIDLAKGDFIWIAESDDWCECTLLESLVEPLISNARFVVSYCSSLNVREDHVESLAITSDFLHLKKNGEDWRRMNLLDQISITNASAAVFRKDAVAGVAFNQVQKYKLIGDRLFWYQLAKGGDVYTTAKFLNYCRRHQANVTESKHRSGVGFLEFLDFLNVVKEDACYTSEVKDYNAKKILDHYLYMEHHESFVNRAARDQVFEAIQEFIPDFKYQYKRSLYKLKLSRAKSRLLALIGGRA